MAHTYNTVQLIRKKREAEELDPAEIHFLINAYKHDRLPDYQMSAFLMAGFLNGMSDKEAAALTEAMLHSGSQLDLSDLRGKKVDKHSTGGVGDKLSLILAPVVASCGVNVPMISGRGLGHTGGTLDKLESISGFDVSVSLDRFRQILQKHRLVMAGQTADIAPADKKMYALRDVTATVEFIPYIASSIMSKKLAEDIDGLVLDVKFGSGAFMKSQEQATELAQSLIAIGESFGTRTIAYLTSMEQPLGQAVGNWLEAREAFEALEGGGQSDVMEITHLLAGTMIYLGDKAKSIEEGVALSHNAIDSGRARACWLKLVEEQQGNPELLIHPESYPKTRHEHTMKAKTDGYISRLDAYLIGLAGIEMGAGRKTKEDRIDPAAGILLHRKTGDNVQKGEALATLNCNSKTGIEKALELLEPAIEFEPTPVDPTPLVVSRIDRDGIYPIG